MRDVEALIEAIGLGSESAVANLLRPMGNSASWLNSPNWPCDAPALVFAAAAAYAGHASLGENRGRAAMAPETPEAIRRLVGGTVAASRRSPKRSRPLGRFAGVPDPIFWKVLEYWRLGDWRRRP